MAKRKRYSKEIKEKAITLYKEVESNKKVADILGINKSTVSNWIKASGLNERNYIKTSEREIIESKVSELYLSGMKIKEVALELNLTYKQVEHIVSTKLKISRHRGPKSKISKEDFFDSIDNEYKAYFLGFIMADGNTSIYNGQYFLKIGVQKEDQDVVIGFLNHIGSSNSIQNVTENLKSGKIGHYTKASLSSVHMVKRLFELSVLPSKSGKETIPSQIPKNLIRHFIRGFFDGDGITDIKKTKRSGFVASRSMLIQIQNEINLFPTIFSNNSVVDYFLIGRSDSKILYDYMYKDSNIWLDRKRNRMDIICGNTEVIRRPNMLLTP